MFDRLRRIGGRFHAADRVGMWLVHGAASMGASVIFKLIVHFEPLR